MTPCYNAFPVPEFLREICQEQAVAPQDVEGSPVPEVAHKQHQ